MRRNASSIIIALVVVGLVAWVAVPNVLTARNRSLQKRTMADMRSIASAWEARATDTNSYSVKPGAAPCKWGCNLERGRVTLEELRAALVPTYIKALPPLDGWGNRWVFRIADVNATGAAQTYIIRSSGSDGSLDAGIDDYANERIVAFDQDIVFVNGTFTQFPEGT